MTFYRKHRPQVIEELDLESVRDSFKKVTSDIEKLPHAFLFAGPRGTGKTSSARILAKVINCENPKEIKEDKFKYLEPCNECDQCKSIINASNLDVIEIDAASHRGIDDVRALRESVGLSPVMSSKKFYIIDEAHMLTTEAANAFLKTLEEPPEHVVFVLATTDPEKLPVTVRSRLHNVRFTKASDQEIKRQVERIAKLEKIKLDKDNIDKIVDLSDGSFRDAAKYLEDVSRGISLSSSSSLDADKILELLVSQDIKKLLEISNDINKSGYSVKDLINNLQKKLQQAIYAHHGVSDGDDYDLNSYEVIEMLELLLAAQSQLKVASDQTVPLQIFFVKWCSKSVTSKKAKVEEDQETVKKKPKIKATSKSASELDDVSWTKILSELREKNASIEALLRAAKPLGIEGNTISLGVYYRFHKERLDNITMRKTLEDVCSDVLGMDAVKVVCSLTERDEPLPARPEQPLQMVKEATVVQAAKEVFG